MAYNSSKLFSSIDQEEESQNDRCCLNKNI